MGADKLGTIDPKHELRPIERKTLAQVVMQRLMDYITDSALQVGDALPSQLDLAHRLGVSRPVLREAMQGLASIGLLEIRPGSGCYVGVPTAGANAAALLFEILTHEEAVEALEARKVVEVELAGLAAERATEEDLRAIASALDRLRTAIARRDETTTITSELHQQFAAAGHNTFLYRMSQLLDGARTAQFSRIEAALPDVKTGEFESHLLLYEAIRSRNPERARAAMREHLEIAHGLEERASALKRSDASDALTGARPA